MVQPGANARLGQQSQAEQEGTGGGHDQAVINPGLHQAEEQT